LQCDQPSPGWPPSHNLRNPRWRERSQESRIKSQEPRAKNQEPKEAILWRAFQTPKHRFLSGA